VAIGDGKTAPAAIVSVPMGQWAVAQAPALIRTLLGSCVGVVLHDRQGKLGGVAHVVLPDSRGSVEHPGKYADTAVPGMIDDLERLAGRKLRTRLAAKLFGGASMFQNTSGPLEIGKLNQAAVERILAGLGVPVLSRDLGGDAGRRLTFDTATGIVSVKVPGREDYDF
jgi:chemotaxis protein CheD